MGWTTGRKSTAKADEERNRDRSKYVTEGKGDTYGLKGKPYTDKTALNKKGDYTPEYEADSRRGLNTWTMRAADGDRKKQDLQSAKDWDNFSITRKGDTAKDDKPKAKPTVKKLKDTSSEYWSADGLSGDHGSASGETGPNMGKVNKGGYDPEEEGMKRGGKVKMMAKGGKVSSASRRADGIAIRGKTRA